MTVVLTDDQLRWLYHQKNKLGFDKVAVEETNLTGVIGATFHVKRRKFTFLVDKGGKTFELIKKARSQ